MIFVDGVRHAISADNVIGEGEFATWTMAIEGTGEVTLAKAGAAVDQGQCGVSAGVACIRPRCLVKLT